MKYRDFTFQERAMSSEWNKSSSRTSSEKSRTSRIGGVYPPVEPFTPTFDMEIDMEAMEGQKSQAQNKKATEGRQLEFSVQSSGTSCKVSVYDMLEFININPDLQIFVEHDYLKEKIRGSFEANFRNIKLAYFEEVKCLFPNMDRIEERVNLRIQADLFKVFVSGLNSHLDARNNMKMINEAVDEIAEDNRMLTKDAIELTLKQYHTSFQINLTGPDINCSTFDRKVEIIPVKSNLPDDLKRQEFLRQGNTNGCIGNLKCLFLFVLAAVVVCGVGIVLYIQRHAHRED